MTLNKAALLSILVSSLSYKLEAASISSGFYAGFGAGMERLNGKRNEWLETDPASYDPQTFTHDKEMKKNSHLANFFGGYLYRYKNFAIAGEAFYEFGKVEDKIDRNWEQGIGPDFKGYFSAALEKKQAFGFRANIGGIIYEKTFLYALLGVSASQLRYSFTSSLLDTGLPLHYQPFHHVKRKLAYGYDYGFGIQYQVQKWRVGMEVYSRTLKNQSYNFNFNPAIEPQPVIRAALKPSLTAITLKALYTF